jgi:hypothetical protein
MRRGWRTDQHHGPVALEEHDVGIDVVRARHRVDDQVGGNASDDLVARHARIKRARPLGAHRVRVGMADAAIGDVDLNVVVSLGAPGNVHGFKRLVGGMGAICFYSHGSSFRCLRWSGRRVYLGRPAATRAMRGKQHGSGKQERKTHRILLGLMNWHHECTAQLRTPLAFQRPIWAIVAV